MAKCPNKNLQEWKDLVAEVGKYAAYDIWDRKYSEVQETYQLNKETLQAPIESLDKKLREWFSVAGVEYKPVEDLMLNGEQIIARADTLQGVLEVVEGRRDATTLAEEAGHFLVDMLPANSPLLRGILHNVEGTEMLKRVREEYGEAYAGNELMLKKEAAGKLIAQEVLQLNQETKETEAKIGLVNRFFDNLIKWVKSRFGFLNSNEVYKQVSPFKEAAELIISPDKLKTEIESNRINKYGESNWNTNESSYYYQVSTVSLDKRAAIIDRLTKQQAIKLANEQGYNIPGGRRLRYRVTDFVKDFYRKTFRRSDLTDSEAQYRKLKGTYIHKLFQLLIDNMSTNQAITERALVEEAKTELLKDIEFRNAFTEIGQDLWSLGNHNGFANLRQTAEMIIKDIEANSQLSSRLSNSSESYKIFTEIPIYNEADDVAGTIDMLVVYPNGVVGMYDFKTMKFYDSKEVSQVKLKAFDIQISWYKRILTENYGVTDFAESRIIPIEVSMSTNGKTYDINTSANKEGYLDAIPIKEYTGEKAFDEELTKLYDYIDTLRKRLQNDYKDDKTRARLYRLEKTVRSILVGKELDFISAELSAAEQELKLKTFSDSNSPDAKLFTDEDANEIREYMDNIKGVISRFTDYLGEPTIAQIESAERILGKIAILESKLYDKSHELANKVNPNEDVSTPHKQIGFFSRLFGATFEINSPIIRKIQTIIQELSFSVINDVNDIAKRVAESTKALEKWAKSNNMSLMDAYKLMINPKSGNLVGRMSEEFWQAKNKAHDAGPASVKKWMETYYTFDKEGYDKFYNKRKEEIEKKHPGTSQTATKKRELALQRVESDYNAAKQDSAVREQNYFLKLNIDKVPARFFNDKWKYIQQNKPLKDFYDMYVQYNKEFAAMTGKDINPYFIAEIRKDAMGRLLNNGVGSLFNVKNLFLELFEVRQYDTMAGSIDTVTGEVLPEIPLLYSSRLEGKLSPSEIKELEKKAVAKYPNKEGVDYLDYLRDLVSEAMRNKGLEQKSFDLARSLIIFSKAAHTHKYLAESEAYVKNLKYFIESKGGRTNLTDGANSTMLDKYTKKVLTMAGIPTSEIELMNTIIDRVWYGRNIQGKDVLFGQKELKDSDGNIIGQTTAYSRNKVVKNLLQYVSIKALGLNPFVAAGNYVGARGNLFMLASEGNIIDKKTLKAANENAYKDREKYMAGSEILQPYPHDRAFEMANELSATKLEQLVTVDKIFFMMKNPDEKLDRVLTNTMMLTYGLDKNGRLVHKSKLEAGQPLLYDKLVKDSEGNWKFEGVSTQELARFRVLTFKLANKIKGTTPQHMKAAYTNTLLWNVLMQFRSWMPGLTTARFKDLTYDKDFDNLDVGRFRVLAGEVLNSGGFLNGIKELSFLLGEATLTGYFGGTKKVNMRATKIAFDKFKEANKDDRSLDELTIEDFIELRKAKLRGVAMELRLYFLFFMLMSLLKSFIPERDDDEASKVERFVARNAYLMSTRGFLELSAFLDPATVTYLIKRPIPSATLITDVGRAFQNFVKNSKAHLTGDKDFLRNNKRPYGYITINSFVPFGNVASTTFDWGDKAPI